ncbi:hypothetical protein ACFPES_10560 [Paenibacillus sp. GCM10023248]|nr:hypothetical protein [Paenibacillus sp. MAHUQ-63]
MSQDALFFAYGEAGGVGEVGEVGEVGGVGEVGEVGEVGTHAICRYYRKHCFCSSALPQ